ncbi:MAG: LexA family protein [Phycisphaeraceae bacterium]
MPFNFSQQDSLRQWGSVAAGFPSPAQGYEDEPLDLHQLLVKRPAATFFFRARGGELRREGIRDGSILVVDRSLTPSPGQLVVADRDGQRVVCRFGEGRADRGGSTQEDEDSFVVWGVVTAAVVRFGSIG